MNKPNTPNNEKPATASLSNVNTTKRRVKLLQIVRGIETWIWTSPWFEVALLVSIAALILGGHYAQ